MGYRKLPYGYRMELGEACVNEEEAANVKQIFSDYLGGASFKSIADELTERSITFDGEKPWNKNMVARLLSDNRYTGKAGFPEIIPIEILNEAAAKRQLQKKPQLPSPDIGQPRSSLPPGSPKMSSINYSLFSMV